MCEWETSRRWKPDLRFWGDDAGKHVLILILNPKTHTHTHTHTSRVGCVGNRSCILYIYVPPLLTLMPLMFSPTASLVLVWIGRGSLWWPGWDAPPPAYLSLSPLHPFAILSSVFFSFPGAGMDRCWRWRPPPPHRCRHRRRHHRRQVRQKVSVAWSTRSKVGESAASVQRG